MVLARLVDTFAIPRSDFIRAEVSSYGMGHVLSIMARFFERYGTDLVLYGGQTASEYLYGYHRMRSATTDLDYLCTPHGIERIVNREPGLRYHPEYDVLFTYADSVPVSFAIDRIHDCPIAPDFFSSAQTLKIPGGFVHACSPEYSIMLKLRRTGECLANRRKPFGKDAIDIINVITGSHLRPDRPELDAAKLVELVFRYVSRDPDENAEIFRRIEEYGSHLPRHDIPVFAAAMDQIYGELDRLAAAGGPIG